MKFSKIKNKIHEIENQFLKYIKNSALILVEDLLKDFDLLCKKLLNRLNIRRKLNHKSLKEGEEHLESSLLNSMKEEKVVVKIAENMVEKGNQNLEFILKNFLNESHKMKQFQS